MNIELQNRIKSFAWRLSGMVLAVLIAFLLENAVDFNIPAWGVVILGLINGEVTKYVNNKLTY